MPTLDEARSIMTDRLGFENFRPGQEQVIDALLNGHSVAAVFPTGAGKSLCYQLPALCFEGLTIVVSPLLALMKDQIDFLLRHNIPAARLDSTLDGDEARDVLRALRAGEVRILYVAPERFQNERFRSVAEGLDISLFAVDEAHCISEWGHNFRPDYLKLKAYAESFGAERCLALTATATPKVLDDIRKAFKIASENAVTTGFYRPNLSLEFTLTTAFEREGKLIDRLQSRPPGATIIYVTLQRTAENVAQQLRLSGFSSRPYHAGMGDENRVLVQEWFFSSENPIVVATIAFGMGIDKADIRYVYHYNMPKSLENYSQEIGRSGRDGNPSQCEAFICPDDRNVLENFVYGDTPSHESIKRFVDHVFASYDGLEVNLYELSRECDIKAIVLKTLLTYLELDGWLNGGTPVFSSYRFKPLMSSKEILDQFTEFPSNHLVSLFRLAKKWRTWFSLDVNEAALHLQLPRHRIVGVLDRLHELGFFEVEAKSVRLVYTVSKRPPHSGELVDDLFERMMQREAADIARLDQVVALAINGACKVSALCAYFGQPLGKDCGHCSGCAQESKVLELESPSHDIDEKLWVDAEDLRREFPDLLGEPRSLSRFLTGSGSPGLTAMKLTRHELFGAMQEIPFQTVLERCFDRPVSPEPS